VVTYRSEASDRSELSIPRSFLEAYRRPVLERDGAGGADTCAKRPSTVAPLRPKSLQAPSFLGIVLDMRAELGN
jgi:hypothetical protein